ncbi:hypothetical protein PUNSTDRAFT_43133 [Punctularia strigosozonata HHB-11173 SS5]|uniref:uncharacterized protein n=1 Tax=Punctularia strigosozonata (strain HHB-11173) TaxID=741275 RepID=UPI0004416E6F|nr:uncharacterized protein PUNSTDRAFT_43133 [Punctularia strigosozonata HHB-11173 SS5]EIN12086.1 hypothetical protein PUNSTDRAFT_43133 [Punctularia strigosozonata HHB-11173 SS5]
MSTEPRFILEDPQNAQDRKKRPRVVTSCDGCRTRKIKCTPSPHVAVDADAPCAQCIAGGLHCTYDDRNKYYRDRNRIPPSLRPVSSHVASSRRTSPRSADYKTRQKCSVQYIPSGLPSAATQSTAHFEYSSIQKYYSDIEMDFGASSGSDYSGSSSGSPRPLSHSPSAGPGQRYHTNPDISGVYYDSNLPSRSPAIYGERNKYTPYSYARSSTQHNPTSSQVPTYPSGQFPLFDPTQPLFPHSTLMPTYWNSVMTSLSQECGFVMFPPVVDCYTTDPALANGIASVGCFIANHSTFSLTGIDAGQASQAYEECVKALALVAWAEYLRLGESKTLQVCVSTIYDDDYVYGIQYALGAAAEIGLSDNLMGQSAADQATRASLMQLKRLVAGYQ